MSGKDDFLKENAALRQIAGRFPSDPAFAWWFLTQPVSGFSEKTPADLVRAGRLNELLRHLEAIKSGVSA